MVGFASDQDGDFEVFTMRADGNQVNRTESPAFDFEPAWQPRGDDRHGWRR